MFSISNYKIHLLLANFASLYLARGGMAAVSEPENDVVAVDQLAKFLYNKIIDITLERKRVTHTSQSDN